MQIGINSIVENDFIISMDSFKWLEMDTKINCLKNKYPNLMNDFNSFDGYSFPSSDYVTQFKDLEDKTRLIQIGNVNEDEWVITDAQRFEFVPNNYLKTKKKYLLDSNCVLISLTGGSDVSNDISSFFDASFVGFLNQRVSAFSSKKKDDELFYYFYALTKSKFFKDQWSGKGGIQKNTVSKERNRTYLPKIKSKNGIKYISLITKAILNKEKLIKDRHQTILKNIEKELKSNQKSRKFRFEFPKFKEIEEIGRFDTGLYNEDFKRLNFLVKNYKHGSIDLISRGFDWSRGTSLEKNFIKTRIDSDTYYPGFYELVLPTNISQYGFVDKSTYIGTPTKLKTISQGDIIFGGEGFGKGRTYVVVEDSNNVATNYHGIRIINKNMNLTESIFIRCFLAFWRSKGMIDFIGVGGSGGHCAPSYFHLIETPLFPDKKQKEIAKLYHNESAKYDMKKCNLNNFLQADSGYNRQAGIYELDKSAKKLKAKLNQAIDDIINDRQVKINFEIN